MSITPNVSYSGPNQPPTLQVSQYAKPVSDGLGDFVKTLVKKANAGEQLAPNWEEELDDRLKKLNNPYLRLYEVPPHGKIQHSWLFAHRDNSKAAVHALTIIKDEAGKEYVHLLVTRRPPFGGALTIETPAGLWTHKDPDQSALDTGKREAREETGCQVDSAQMLSENFFATSPGGMTEMKAFVLANISGTPNRDFQEKSEHDIIVDKIDVPLEVFQDYEKFTQWLREKKDDGFLVGMDVIAARGLMPPAGSRLSVEA